MPDDQLTSTLTKRQLAIYEFLVDKITNRGYPPTVREIGKAFGISSPNGVMCHLKALERKGLIERKENESRAMTLTQQAMSEERGLPLCGQVAAGVLHEAVEQAERIDFGEIFGRKDVIVLEVKGDSMIEAHIDDGDYVVVRNQETAQPGQMVVAETPDGEATLKYWHPEGGRIRLQPANGAMAPIIVDDAKVRGVVIGVVRQCG